MCWKLTEASHETSILRLQNLEVPTKTRRKTSIWKLQSVKIGGSLARNARFGAPTCLVSGHWFSGGFAVSMGEAAKHVLSACFKLWKLEEVSHEWSFWCSHASRLESLVFLWRRRVYGGSCKTSFSKVSKQAVMSFCVAGVALCDIPTCLITCRNCQNWRKSRTKCSFFCTHVSRLESLVFLWRRRVYGGSCKTSPFRRFPSRLSCRFAWQAWHFVTFCLITCRNCQNWRKSRTKCSFFLHPRVSSRVSGFPVASPCLWGKLRTQHSTLCTPHSTIYTLLDSTLYTLHSILYTLHFTLLTPHSRLYT